MQRTTSQKSRITDRFPTIPQAPLSLMASDMPHTYSMRHDRTHRLPRPPHILSSTQQQANGRTCTAHLPKLPSYHHK